MRKDGLARPRFAKVDPGDGAEDIKIGYTSRKPVDLKNYYKNSIAIIIGISKYKEENQLPNAYNDAIAIKRYSRESMVLIWSLPSLIRKRHMLTYERC